MNKRTKLAAAVLAAMTVLSAGCAGHQASAGAEAGDAAQDLRDAVTALRDGNYTFTRTGASFVADIRQGTVALPGGASIKHTDTFEVARAGTDTYLRYLLHVQPEMREQYRQYWKKNAPAADAKRIDEIYDQLDGTNWVRTSDRQLTETADVEEQSGLDSMARLPTTEQPDATGAGVLIDAVTSAERSGDEFTGTLDATGQDPLLQRLFNDAAHLYGPAAKAMPFRATVDDQGRLTELTVTMPSEMTSQPAEPYEPAPPVVIRISGYGTAAAPSVPAEVEGELTKEAYDLLARDTD